MNWINGVDMLQNQNGEAVLEGYSDPEKRDESLVDRIDMVLDGSEPSKDMIKQVGKSMIKKMKATTKEVEAKWKEEKVTSEMQNALKAKMSLMGDKAFLIMSVYQKMLNHPVWNFLSDSIYKNANRILSEIIPLVRKADKNNKDDDVFSTLSYHMVRRYLSCCACCVLTNITTEDGKLPLDLLLPTIRRLGMVDVLDEKLAECNDWNGILKDLERHGDKEGSIPRTPADTIVQERCQTWRKARASLNYYLKKSAEEPPDGFEYFAKCCCYDCSNFETAENRHSVRCQKCWYFHCCSPGCESYAERAGFHKCNVISSQATALIKKQAQLHLRAYCNFCSALQDDLSEEVIRCSGCNKVQYCSEDCKEWDLAEGKHSEQCQQ